MSYNFEKILRGKKSSPKDTNETSADSSGSFEGALSGPLVKRKIKKIHNFEEELSEVTDSSSSGQYDTSYSAGRSNPLKINGPNSIMNSRAVKDKKKEYIKYHFGVII